MTSPPEQQTEALVTETREWIADFEEGMFHVSCLNCNSTRHLPPEFYGLVESQKELADRLDSLAAQLAETKRENEALSRGLLTIQTRTSEERILDLVVATFHVAALSAAEGECTGAKDCPAETHIHGCFAEREWPPARAEEQG